MYRIIIIALFATACSSDDSDVDPIPPDSGGEVDGQSSDTGPLADTGDLADMFQAISDMAMPDMAVSAQDMGAALLDMARPTDMANIDRDMAMPDMAPDAGPMIAMGFEVGQRAPNFILDDHTGNPVSLMDTRGQYTLVFGTSSW